MSPRKKKINLILESTKRESIVDKQKVFSVILTVIMVVAFSLYYFVYGPGDVRPDESPEVIKDIRVIHGKFARLEGKAIVIRVTRVVNPNSPNPDFAVDERKISISERTRVEKAVGGNLAGRKANSPVFKEIKLAEIRAGELVAAYSDQNILDLGEFTATRIEVLPETPPIVKPF